MANIYLLVGEDSFSKEEFEKKFITAKVDPQWETFNLEILSASDASVDKIVEAADSPPFGFGDKVVLVKNSEVLFSQKEELLKPLEQLLAKKLMETNYLIFSASSVDKRKTIVKNLLQYCEVKEFNILKSWELTPKLTPWVEDFFRKREKRIEREGVEELINATAGNKHRLESEIEKLIIYSDERKIITKEDVRALVVNTESDLFEFLEMLAKQEVGNALQQLNKLLLREPAIKLISSLSSNIRNIYGLKLLADEGLGYADVAKRLGQKPFLIEKNLKLWRKIDSNKFRNILKDLMNLELKFKSTSVNFRLELEKLILKNFSN